MATRPKVSVIIPAYNAELFIAEAVASVLSQSFKDLECLVINDGSTDRTLQILKQFGHEIITVSQENQGVSQARNRGIREAKGEWLAFLDADDIWLENKLTTQLEDLQKAPGVKLHSTNLSLERSHVSACNYFDMIKMPQSPGSGSCVLENPADELLKYHFPWLQTTLVHRTLINSDDDLFNPKISLYEDFEWLLKLSFKSSWMISKQILVEIKRRDNAEVCLSAARSKNELKAAEIMLEILELQYQQRSHRERKILAGPLGRQHSYLGNLYKGRGNRTVAREHYLKGLMRTASLKLLMKYMLSVF